MLLTFNTAYGLSAWFVVHCLALLVRDYDELASSVRHMHLRRLVLAEHATGQRVMRFDGCVLQERLLATPPEPSFAKKFPSYEGCCMGNRKTCVCGAPFLG